MRKNVFGRQLKRDTNERKALFKSLISSLVLHGRIQTTEEKAKAVKGQIDKVITKAKKSGTNAGLGEYLTNEAFKKLISDVVPSVTNRNSGYTRIIRLGERFADAASMVMLEWVDIDQIKNPASQRGEQKPATTEAQKKNETQKNKLSASNNFSVSVVARKTSTKQKRIRRAKKEENEK